MVEPSIVKKTKTRTRVHDEGGISHEEAEGQMARNKDVREDTWDHGRRRGRTVAPGAGPAKGRAKRAEQGGHHRRAKVLFLLKIVSTLLFFSILQMVSHVFMADVGHSGQILSYADSAWSCVSNDIPCLLCCRRDFDLIEAEKPAAFRPLSRTPAQLFFFLHLPIRLFCAVFAAVFAEGLLSSTSDSIVNLTNGGFACDIRYHIIGVCLSSFACRPATASVVAVL